MFLFEVFSLEVSLGELSSFSPENTLSNFSILQVIFQNFKSIS